MAVSTGLYARRKPAPSVFLTSVSPLSGKQTVMCCDFPHNYLIAFHSFSPAWSPELLMGHEEAGLGENSFCSKDPMPLPGGVCGANGQLALPGSAWVIRERGCMPLLSCHTCRSLYIHHPVPRDTGKFCFLHPLFPLQGRPRPFQAEEDYSLGKLSN